MLLGKTNKLWPLGPPSSMQALVWPRISSFLLRPLNAVFTLVTFANSTPTVTFTSIVPALQDSLQCKLYDHPPALQYLIRPNQTVALTHVAQFRNHETDTWVEVFACAHSGKILSITNFVAHASYNVVPINKQGLPDGREMLKDPADTTSSPLGWHNDGQNKTIVTAYALSSSSIYPN